jgi:hypothetical protein
MSKKNYNINIQDSSYYISLNIIKKKQQQQQQQEIDQLKPIKTFNFKSTKPNLPSPYDEILTRKKQQPQQQQQQQHESSSTNIDKLKHRLKLVNDISNIKHKISYPKKLINASPLTSSLINNNNNNKNNNRNQQQDFKLNSKNRSPYNNNNKFKNLFETPLKQPTHYESNYNLSNTKNNRPKYPIYKRSISATDDYTTADNLNKKSNYFLQTNHISSSFSLEKPSCIAETKEEEEEEGESSINIVNSSMISLSSSKTLSQTNSSYDLDKISVNKFLLLNNKGNYYYNNNNNNNKSNIITKLLTTNNGMKLKNNKNEKPLESSQMSSIRSMGTQELELYIDSLIRQFRLKSRLNNEKNIKKNVNNISTVATMTSSAGGGSDSSSSSTSTKSNQNIKNPNNSSNELIKQQINNDKTIEEEPEEEEEEEDESTFINYTHSYELEDLNDSNNDTQLSLDEDEDLNFEENTN